MKDVLNSVAVDGCRFLRNAITPYTANVQADKNRLQGLACSYNDIPIFGVVGKEIAGRLFICQIFTRLWRFKQAQGYEKKMVNL